MTGRDASGDNKRGAMRGMRGTRIACLVVLGIGLGALVAGADERPAGCDAGCEDREPAFPDAVTFLAGHGYPQTEYQLLLTWNELAPADRSVWVVGYRLQPLDGTEPFDIYANLAGRLLTSADMRALGVRAKDWDVQPKSVPEDGGRRAVGLAIEPVAEACGPRLGLAPCTQVDLPELDLEAVRLEDADHAAEDKGVVRTGVFRELPDRLVLSLNDASMGTWQGLEDGGKLWSAALHSPGAIGQRIHLARIDMPEGGRVVVYNAADPSEIYGPFVRPQLGEADVWTPTCFGETVVVECFVPEGAELDDAPLLVVDRITHMYKGLGELPWAPAENALWPAGYCNLDVTCYPDWATTALGVGGLGTIGLTGSLWCTGSLLVDTDPSTDIPYVLTANHCVRTQDGTRGASTIEVYWLYQTDTCDGTVPSPLTVPRTTGGADYLAGSGGTGYTGGGNDFTLLRLRQTPPAGLSYLGWRTVGQDLGTEVTCIHHPSGDYKRISFGTLTDEANLFDDLYYEVVWHDGTTEHGSSGSPMMLTDTHQIIGQLWGGRASCLLPNEPDYYGRFNITFPVIESYLDPLGLTPEVDFEVDEFHVEEEETVITIQVFLDVPPGEEVSVEYITLAGSAEAGEDFVVASGTLTFDGTTQSASFEVTIHQDYSTEVDETIVVRLINPEHCTLAGINNPAIITIEDNDPDTDNDGLSDYEEEHALFGYVTDPEEWDTDGDGYSDYEEIMGVMGLTLDPTQPSTLSSLSVPYFVEVTPRGR